MKEIHYLKPVGIKLKKAQTVYNVDLSDIDASGKKGKALLDDLTRLCDDQHDLSVEDVIARLNDVFEEYWK